VEPADLAPDTVGRGNIEGQLEKAAAVVERVTSKGYVRSKFLVVSGSNAASLSADIAGSTMTTSQMALSVDPETAIQQFDARAEEIKKARMKGYEGDACPECGNFTLVRNGTCLKCDTCGGTTGCS
jgi:ribonucleoside-diphosphate reductase alpha chain